MLLLQPSGSQIVHWLAEKVTGIGIPTAQKLWSTLGEKLYKALDDADHDAISKVIKKEEIRNGLFNTWAENGDAKTLKFVQENGIPLGIARKVIKFHQSGTINKLLADPYRLLSFEGSWKVVDKLARDRFGIAVDDSRRLAAALEEALYKGMQEGHTCQTLDDLYNTALRLLAPHPQPKNAFNDALLLGQETGQFYISQQGEHGEGLMLHASGTWVMEKEVAQFISTLLSPIQQQDLFSIDVNQTPIDVDQLISDFEHDERKHLGLPDFSLNSAQRQAVHTSFNHRFSIITGGAGVGKTTVLKALYRALDTIDKPRFQMALSGRATARMIEATHEPAMTIAGFLRNVTADEMGDAPVIVIDESSMLDLITFYRLTLMLPANCHLILVGDPYQLPPIGAGLILHLLCKLNSIPTTELTVVKRQAADSGIPVVSKQIRDGIWPNLHLLTDNAGKVRTTSINSDVTFIPCADQHIIPTVLNLYETDRKNTQILCATRSCRFAGIDEINKICHSRYVGNAEPLWVNNKEIDEIEDSGFRVGDLIMYTANAWGRNLQNGSLGQLTAVFPGPISVNVGTAEKPMFIDAIGTAVFEGKEQYVLAPDIDNMQHAYAITVHKSQGSQFPRVIVPIRRSGILDRTFVYTAVTRAQCEVILVGDEMAAKKAVEALPKAFQRKVGLTVML